MATIIDGKAAAASVIATVKEATANLQRAKGIQPGLAVVIVGDDPASHAYVKAKARMANECGFNSVQYTLPETTQQHALERLVANLNADPNILGILVQLPLPKHLHTDVVLGLISPRKMLTACTWSTQVRSRPAT